MWAGGAQRQEDCGAPPPCVVVPTQPDAPIRSSTVIPMLSSYMHCCTRPTILLRPTHVICKEDGIPFGKLLRQSFEEGQRAFRAGREMIEPGAQELYEEARASGLAGNLGDLKTQLTKMTEVSPQQLVSDLCRSIVLSILFVETCYFAVVVVGAWLATPGSQALRVGSATTMALSSRGATRGCRLLAEVWQLPQALSGLLAEPPARRSGWFRRSLLQALLLPAVVLMALNFLERTVLVRAGAGVPALLLITRNPMFRLIDSNGDGMLALSEVLDAAKALGAFLWENGARAVAAGGPLRTVLSSLTLDDLVLNAFGGVGARFAAGLRGDVQRVIALVSGALPHACGV